MDALFSIILYVLLCTCANGENYTVALFYPFKSSMTLNGTGLLEITSAIANDRLQNITSSIHLDFTYLDSKCELGTTLDLMNSMTCDSGWPHLIMEAGCDDVCELLAEMATQENLAIVSLSSRLNSLSDKLVYPSFARLVSPFTHVAEVIEAVVIYFGWDAVGIMGTRYEQDLWHFGSDEVLDRMNALRYRANLYFLETVHRRNVTRKIELIMRMARENRSKCRNH